MLSALFTPMPLFCHSSNEMFWFLYAVINDINDDNDDDTEDNEVL